MRCAHCKGRHDKAAQVRACATVAEVPSARTWDKPPARQFAEQEALSAVFPQVFRYRMQDCPRWDTHASLSNGCELCGYDRLNPPF